jgi:quinol monooxygenase YgiN
MIPEILRYNIPADQKADFEQDYASAAEQLRANEHCLGYQFLESDKEPGRYLVTLWWDSEEGHIQGFRSSPQFPPFLAIVRKWIPMMEEMEHYHALPLKWMR